MPNYTWALFSCNLVIVRDWFHNRPLLHTITLGLCFCYTLSTFSAVSTDPCYTFTFSITKMFVVNNLNYYKNNCERKSNDIG